MRRLFISLCLLCISVLALAKSWEVQPLFQGQHINISFKKWVDERLVYDAVAKAEGIQGRVTLSFTIEEDGTLDKVKVLRGVDPRLDAEAVRVVSSSPVWTPGTRGGKPATFNYVYPVIFKLDTPNPYPCDKFVYEKTKHGNQELSIYSVTHGSLVLRMSGAEIIIDPVMSLGGKRFQYGWFRPGRKAAILITHEHNDHLNKEAIEYLRVRDTTAWARKNVGEVQLFGNRKAVEALGTGKVLENGDTVSIDRNKVHIKAVPAYNTTKGHTNFHPKGNGNGYLIEIGELVIYVAGDTELIPEMKKLGKVDIAFLPVNQPYTMTPEQCIKAAKIIKPKVLIPYHMGDTDMTPVIKEFEGSDIKVIFHEELR